MSELKKKIPSFLFHFGCGELPHGGMDLCKSKLNKAFFTFVLQKEHAENATKLSKSIK